MRATIRVIKRKSNYFRVSESKRIKEKRVKDQLNSDIIISKYLEEIAQGPTFCCCCCGCLYFRKTVVIFNQERLESVNPLSRDIVQVFLSSRIISKLFIFNYAYIT